MKKTILKVTIVVLLIALMAATFTACSIFEGLFQTANNAPKIEEVSISVSSGLTKANSGVYAAKVGDQFVLKAVINEDAPKKPAYQWYLTTDGIKQAIDEANGNLLKYTFSEYSEKTYVFSLSVDGVESKNTISVIPEYADKIENAQILSTSHNIVGGIVQQNLKDISPITFVAGWNKASLPEGTAVSIKWTIEGEDTVLGSEEEFEYVPDGAGTTTIKLTLSDGANTISTTVTLIVVEVFASVDNISLVLEDGGERIGEGVLTQYYQSVDGEERLPIRISAVVNPVGETDFEAPVLWMVRDKEGQRTLSDTGRTITFVPAYGETIVTATIDNVVSKQLVFFAFTANDYSTNQDYILDTFVWEMGVENGYITDQTDLNRFMQYAVSTRVVTEVVDNTIPDTSTGFPFKTADEFDIIKDGDSHPDALSKALSSLDEAGYVAIRTGYLQNGSKFYDYKLYIVNTSLFMNPSKNYSPAVNVTQDETAIVHYSVLENSEKRTSLPIDDNPEYPEAIKDSQMLYRVVGWGYKPTFDSSEESQKMKALYEKIRRVAIDYVTEDMTDYEKALIFYEWIAQNVDYDYAVVESYLSTEEKLTYNAFSLEGVFNDADGEGYGQAVCDGRAKAYVVLCGLEDITCIRVTGQAQVGGTSEGHAWNKVLIDADGDGKKEWYFCDTTWSDRSSASNRVEMLNKQYFLVNDAYVKKTHVADEGVFNPVCDTRFDYYSKTVIENGNKDFDLYIESFEELSRAIIYAKENGILLEIKVSSRYALTDSALAFNIKNILRTNGGTVDFDLIMLATASDYSIYTVVFN